jgi:cytochrome c oxidase subunit 2
MPCHLRPRRLAHAALTVALLALGAACAQDHPDTIFHSHTDFNRDVGGLFGLLIWIGAAVFVLVEGVLIYTMVRFRDRPGQHEPANIHGNTTLEIAWTAIPALILVFIAIPTVRVIFRTQAKAAAGALQVDVIAHQWWWEFRYPEYGVTTADELYLPIGRTVNFALTTKDVLHSFWIPSMGGKRDVISNRTNYLWFTPDSVGAAAWNGSCAEYCGVSHANMRFKVFTLAPADFQSWVTHQQAPAVFTLPPPPAPAAPAAPAPPGKPAVAAAAPPPAALPQPLQAGFVEFPRERIPAYAVPQTPTPAELAFDARVTGDATRGAQLLTQGGGGCLACHTIKGNPMMIGQIGPNLTHLATRSTIAGGLFPNDTRHLARWIKNSRLMKPGVIMPTLGLGEYDPILKAPQRAGLTDQQVADIVAYLERLK